MYYLLLNNKLRDNMCSGPYCSKCADFYRYHSIEHENISMSNLCLQTTCRQLLHKPDMRWCDQGTHEPKPSRCRYVAVMYSFCLIEYMKVSCSRCKPLFLQQQYSMELSGKFILKSYMYISLLFYVINNTAYNNLLD